MSIIKIGNVAHDTACNLAESVRQVSSAAAGSNQALMDAASISYFKSVIASGVTNGIEVGDFREALHRLTGSYG
jgi:hypothetical protein